MTQPEVHAAPGGSADPRNSLSLLAQFGAEYLLTMADRPATRECVNMQMRDCVQRIDAALQELAMLKATQNASALA